jgi:signal transduction histidine kinase
MTAHRPLHHEERFLVLAPSGRNAVLTSSVLAEGGIAAEICADLDALCFRISGGAGGAMVMEECLGGDSIGQLIECLSEQPPWSDFPLIVVTTGGASTEASWGLMRSLARVGNVSVLERPLRVATLVSAAQVALRSRRRQYELRDQLVERERAREELLRHRDRLEEEVRQRTAELEASHQRLRLSERMASLGTLSAGLGHDMGNLLLPIRVRLDSLDTRDLPTDVKEDLAAIRTSAEYLRRLSDGLRLLALDPDDATAGEHKPLGDWWLGVEPVLKSVLPRGTWLKSNLNDDPTVLAIPTHLLTQAIFNLVQNAGDALRGRTSGNVQVRRGPSSQTSAILEVADDGPGMPDDVRQRCLEPFFTTKTRGFSTGLGLALVHSIVSRAGGSLTVASTVGEGTVFSLTLPLASSEDAQSHLRPRVLAAIDVCDARLRSLIGTVIAAYGIEDGVPRDRAAVLVTDAVRISLEEIRRFLAADDHRRVVLLGDSLPPDVSGRIRAVGRRPASGTLREALREAASACQEKRT